MYPTYENVLKSSDCLSFAEASQLQTKILAASNLSDTDFMDLYESMVQAAIKYTKSRADWNFKTPVDRGNSGAARTAAHNDFISQLQVLARYMAGQDWNTNWQQKLGLESANENRKKIGDFANFMTYLYAINSR